jgi:hypothetical protein
MKREEQEAAARIPNGSGMGRRKSAAFREEEGGL